jgi:hypothetical protein
MNISPDTARRSDFTIQGVVLSIPEPFLAGHVVTEGEASALNQLLAENVRNNLAEDVKESKEKGLSLDAIQKIVDDYVQEYEFGVRRIGFRTSDPVESAAREIALELAKRQARKAGKTLKDYGNEALRKDADEALADPVLGPKIRAKAERIAAERASALEDL